MYVVYVCTYVCMYVGFSHTCAHRYRPYFCLHTVATYVTVVSDLIRHIKQHYTIYRNTKDLESCGINTIIIVVYPILLVCHCLATKVLTGQ